MTQKLKLQKPVSGAKLVEIVQATVDTLNAKGSRYELQDGKGYPFQELTPDNSDLVINCGSPLNRGLFDHSPNYLVAFRGITSDKQYSSVELSTQVWGLRTMGIKDIDIDAPETHGREVYREITDKITSEIVRYSGMDELPRRISPRRNGPMIY